MFLFLNFLKQKKEPQKSKTVMQKPQKPNEQAAARKGNLGEYKIDIQLGQLPKGYRHLSDLLVKNPKAISGYSQVDHVLLTPYGIFVIETKNYQGTIYSGKGRKTWLVNGKFKMMNPFVQNYGHIKALGSFIDKKPDLFISVVSFTKRCTFKVDLDYRKMASNELIVYDVELSEFIHRKVSVLKLHHKEPLLTENDITEIYHTFLQANITDSKVREGHKQKLRSHTTSKPSGRAACHICDKPVSAKVKSFCLDTEKFKGKIYCFEHQKGIH